MLFCNLHGTRHERKMLAIIEHGAKAVLCVDE